jgi:hypothetical protein
MRAQPEEAPFTEEEEEAFVHPCTGERTETSVESRRKQGHAFVGEIEYRILPDASKPKSTRPPPQSVTPPPCNSSHDNAKSNGGEEESLRRRGEELREAQRDERKLKEAAKSSGGEQKSDSKKARRNEKGSKGEASKRGTGDEKEDENDAEGDGKKSERKSIRTRTPRTSEKEKMQDESEDDERKSECMQARKARRSESGEVVAISKGGKEEDMEDECGEDGEKDSFAGEVSLEALEKAREKVESVLKERERKGAREDDGVEREFEELVRKHDKAPT